MDRECAFNILTKANKDGVRVSPLSWCVTGSKGQERYIKLDGAFTVDQLKAIIWWVENNKYTEIPKAMSLIKKLKSYFKGG